MSNDPISVLDHGYVKLIQSWGSDEVIIESARMSTGKGFQGWGTDRMLVCPDHGLLEGDYRKGDICYPQECCIHCLNEGKDETRTQPTTRGKGDEKLLSYLYTNKHLTPFEQCGLTIEVQAPIFVFREWHRHRTQSYNEMSARYTPLPDVNYTPADLRCTPQPTANKQATSDNNKIPTLEEIHQWLSHLENLYRDIQDCYNHGLMLGIPKEVARVCLPVGRYSRMRASANLRNWLQFLELRLAPNAQWEIRQYAGVVGNLISKLFPRTWELFSADMKQKGIIQ